LREGSSIEFWNLDFGNSLGLENWSLEIPS
jgi:hypothetical protein